MHFLLQAAEMLNQFFKNLDPTLNQEVVCGLRFLKGTPHNSLELISHVQEVLGLRIEIPVITITDALSIISQNLSQMLGGLENRVQIDPVILS